MASIPKPPVKGTIPPPPPPRAVVIPPPPPSAPVAIPPPPPAAPVVIPPPPPSAPVASQMSPSLARAVKPDPLVGELLPKLKKNESTVMVNGRLCVSNLHAYQIDTVNHILTHPYSMLWLGLGLGKMCTLSTPILTVNGWKTHGTIKAGDVLVHPKGGTNIVTQIHPIAHEEIYELELMDGRIAECHADHLWTVDVESTVGSRTDGTRRNRVVSKTFTTAELMSRSYKRYALQRIERIDLPEKDLPIEPYLLGALIADGALTKTSVELCGHVDDTFIFEKCAGLLPKGVTCSKVSNYSGKSARMCIHAGIKPLLNEVGLLGKHSGERFIPEDYLNSSYEQRLALLRGLMDCDGSIRSRNRKQYSTTSRQLSEDIHQLVMTLGGTTSVCTSTRPDKPDSETIEYNISITFVDVNPFSLPRKANKVEPSTRDRVSSKIKEIRKTGRYADMRCISTERADGLYIINDYMVTHNTISTLTAIIERKRRGLIGKTLIVAPLRVCQMTWKQEADNWDHTKHLTFSSMIGTARERQRALFSEADIYLTNFESLGWLALQLQEYFINQNTPLPFDYIVFDEISKMKRPESQRFKDFQPIIPHFKYSTGLTASPASNGLHNMWGQFYVVDGGERLGGNYPTFKQRYFSKGNGAYGKSIPHDDTREQLVAATSDITIEISPEGLIDLPKFKEIDIMVRLTPKLMEGYLALERDFILELDDGGELEIFNEAALASKLLQYSSGVVYNVPEPELRPDYRIEGFVHKLKDEALDDIISDSGDEPIMLAYQFSSERDRIMKKYKFAKCLTNVKGDEATAIMDEFNSGSLKLLLVHPASAGYGLNLQKACCTIVWYGLGYNLEAYEQTIGRIQRQGNKSSTVTCFRILTHDTMDLAVAEALADKDMVQSALKSHMREFAKRKHNS